MDIQTMKQTSIVEFLQRLGHSPVRRRANEVWFNAPYRKETSPSFRVNLDKNLWMDFGLGKGGDIFSLAGEIIVNNDFVTQAKYVSEALDLPFIPNDNHLFENVARSNEPSFEDVKVQPLSHVALIGYLAERGIPARIAAEHCRQVYYRTHGKQYFAIGFPNMAGGYEIRNKFFKGCIPPKDISLLKGTSSQSCSVFEGFMDFLSAKALGWVKAEDCMVLNSVSNINKAVKYLSPYAQIDCYLDNDEAGQRTIKTLRKQFGEEKVRDRSELYGKSKDVNEHLMSNKKRNTIKL